MPQAFAQEGVSLTIEAPKHEFARGEVIPITIVLRNNSDKPLAFNARMLVNSKHAPKRYREVTLLISNQNGTIIPFESKINAGAPKASNLSTLQPGKSYSSKLDLTRDHDFRSCSRLNIRATYQDGSSFGPSDVHGLQLISGPIESNQLSIVLK